MYGSSWRWLYIVLWFRFFKFLYDNFKLKFYRNVRSFYAWLFWGLFYFSSCTNIFCCCVCVFTDCMRFVCVRDIWVVPCIPHNIIVNNLVAFRCVFVYQPLLKNIINRFSSNMFWVGFWLIGRFCVYSWAGNRQSDLATHAVTQRYAIWKQRLVQALSFCELI